MRITLPTESAGILWEGKLEPPAVTYGAAEAVYAAVRQPDQWAEGQLLGKDWQPPVGGDRYYLVRLIFALRLDEPDRAQVIEAHFGLSLARQGARQARVFDAFPREQLQANPLPVTLGIGPEFKLGTAEASLAKAETTIDFGEAFPVIRSEGLASSAFTWHYAAHAQHPLRGDRMMYAVVALRPGMNTALATLTLVADVQDRYGLKRVSAHNTDKLRCVLGQ